MAAPTSAVDVSRSCHPHAGARRGRLHVHEERVTTAGRRVERQGARREAEDADRLPRVLADECDTEAICAARAVDRQVRREGARRARREPDREGDHPLARGAFGHLAAQVAHAEA